MAACSVQSVRCLSGSVVPPSDKSLLHRAMLFNAIAEGCSRVSCSSLGRDTLATARILQQLGVSIRGSLPDPFYSLALSEQLLGLERCLCGRIEFALEGSGFAGLRPPGAALYCGNSGTTARLLSGVLAGCPFTTELSGDESLSKRPMKRVTKPLSQMGASFSAEYLPMSICGGNLRGLRYDSPVASAQVKSALILAALQAEGESLISEPVLSRNHTETMLRGMGAELQTSVNADGKPQVRVPARKQDRHLKAKDFQVPGDVSQAAFLVIGALLLPGSEITVVDVGVNRTRTGLLDILRRMGGRIELSNRRTLCGEDLADIVVVGSKLRGVEVGGEDVVRAIDEIPILSVAAAFADGVTEIRGAEELRVKESDRLRMTAAMLADGGVSVEELDDGLRITGDPKRALVGQALRVRPNSWSDCHDHRVFMAAAVFELASTGAFSLLKPEVVETSFPSFSEYFQSIAKE